MKMHNSALIAIASSMLPGGSEALSPRSWAKNAKKGILIPACSRTPAEANSSTNQSQSCPSAMAAAITIDLLTNPQKSGTAEMEAAPTRHSTVVLGIFFHSPPRSVPQLLPVT